MNYRVILKLSYYLRTDEFFNKTIVLVIKYLHLYKTWCNYRVRTLNKIEKCIDKLLFLLSFISVVCFMRPLKCNEYIMRDKFSIFIVTPLRFIWQTEDFGKLSLKTLHFSLKKQYVMLKCCLYRILDFEKRSMWQNQYLEELRGRSFDIKWWNQSQIFFIDKKN